MKNKTFRGLPGLVINAPNATVQGCYFYCLPRQGKVAIEDLIRGDGRWPGGVKPE